MIIFMVGVLTIAFGILAFVSRDNCEPELAILFIALTICSYLMFLINVCINMGV